MREEAAKREKVKLGQPKDTLEVKSYIDGQGEEKEKTSKELI
jgi:hypothetical protein